MKIKNLIVTSLGLLVTLTVLTACSSPSANPDAKKSAEPSDSSSPVESDTFDPISFMAQGKARVVQNDLDEEFLTIAQKSCTKAYEDGLIYKSSEGATYFKQDPNALYGNWKFSQVTMTNNELQSPGIYTNYLPAFFDPCDTMVSGALLSENTDSLILEHSLKKNADGTYTWGQHHGGAALDETTYFVGSDGLFSKIVSGKYTETASYGPLTQEQLDYFK